MSCNSFPIVRLFNISDLTKTQKRSRMYNIVLYSQKDLGCFSYQSAYRKGMSLSMSMLSLWMGRPKILAPFTKIFLAPGSRDPFFFNPQVNSQCSLNSSVFCSHAPCSLSFLTSCSLLPSPFTPILLALQNPMQGAQCFSNNLSLL